MQKHPDLPQAFVDLGIEIRFLKAIQKMHFEKPSPIQEKLIPPSLKGLDILGQARTGTGKTAAFGLPALQLMDPAKSLQAICLVPTRELAVQVTGELKRLSEYANLHIVAVYGGQKIATQLHQLGKKPHFVVGTPGRILDFLNRGVLNFENIQFAVLDEVDRMLDIGFRDDIRNILGRIKSKHQTVFVSATIDDEIKRLSRKYMNDPIEINVSKDKVTVDEVDQTFVSVESYDKFRLLRLILKQEDPNLTIVFCNTKHIARKLAKKLFEAGIDAKEIHGDLIQHKRDRVMERFRRHQIRILVATDLASRGIDVSEVSHIINYDIPKDPEIYVHRIGRTARMGSKGTAITFVTKEQGKEITNVEKLINQQVPARKVEGFVPRPSREDHPAHVKSQSTDGSGKRTNRKNTPETPKPPAPQKTLSSRLRRPGRKRRLR